MGNLANPSLTHYSDSSYNDYPDTAISDGNLTTYVQCMSWISINLGSPKILSLLRIAVPNNYARGAFGGAVFQGSNNSTDGLNGDWTILYTFYYPDDLINGTFGPFLTLPGTTAYKFYGISGLTGALGRRIILEWELIEQLSNPLSFLGLKNAARGKTYTVSPTPIFNSDPLLTKLTDGLIGTTPTESDVNGVMWNSGTPEVIIDLETTTKLFGCRFYFMTDLNGSYPPETITIYGSVNGTDYTPLNTFYRTSDWEFTLDVDQVVCSSNLPLTGSYKYIKTVFTRRSGNPDFRLHLSEVEIYKVRDIPTTQVLIF